MNISISYQEVRDPEKSVIYLINKSCDSEKLSFTKTEAAYVKDQIESGEKFIHINSYFKHSFVIVIPDNGKPDYQIREKLRSKGHKLCGIANDNKIENLVIDDRSDFSTAWEDITEGIVLSNYQFNNYLKKPKVNSLSGIEIITQHAGTTDVKRLQAMLRGVCFARDLVNEPHSHLNAIRFAEILGEKFRHTGLSVESLFKKQIESLKMGGLIAVNKGSEVGPSFTIVEWKPKNPVNDKPIVLVGKGVMFDTGGLSLKSTKGSMDVMKSDMAGAAAVAAVMLTLAETGSKQHVIGLMPATDNRPGKDAFLPQDVIHMHDGTTVEVLNTDAEGRMILADALSYAKQYKPELVIDLATLTGAAEVAVGIKAIAAMGNAPEDMDILKKSGFARFERIAELPFWDDYKEELKSDIADLQNVGGRNAGCITAGKFLEHFTDYPYIHLDIAGPAFLESKDSYRGKNGTGTGVRLLHDFFYFREHQ
ncbi:MAG: leucyl aminopeptidase family protein [Bacteroidales bacterium]